VDRPGFWAGFSLRDLSAAVRAGAAPCPNGWGGRRFVEKLFRALWKRVGIGGWNSITGVESAP
jgi:hypothetical protein